MKQVCKCGQPVQPRRAVGRFGWHHECRACHRAYMKAYRWLRSCVVQDKYQQQRHCRFAMKIISEALQP